MNPKTESIAAEGRNPWEVIHFGPDPCDVKHMSTAVLGREYGDQSDGGAKVHGELRNGSFRLYSGSSDAVTTHAGTQS